MNFASFIGLVYYNWKSERDAALTDFKNLIKFLVYHRELHNQRTTKNLFTCLMNKSVPTNLLQAMKKGESAHWLL